MQLPRWIPLSCGVALAAALCLGLLAAPAGAASKDPRSTRAFFVDPYMPAAQAAKADPRFAAIGNRPQALWLTDYYPLKGTKRVVGIKQAAADYANRALEKKRTPVVALYAIPDRDCGLYSSGGFKAGTYKQWVKLAAAGLKGKKAIAILEPDALAFYGSSLCKNAGDRLALLRYAAKKLHDAGVWVHIDAGHHIWQPAGEVASRLVKAGVAPYAKGFSLNVGNYQRTKDEIAYGNQVVSELRKRGAKGKRYVIETARNGADNPPADGNDTCNPWGQRIGTKAEWPRMVRQGNLDAYVWIKHPGESDGPCNGGPGSGAWWPEGALRLMGLA
ncbi:glycoside hydrolase family 6 protein [Aeromicrobium stalagmiti]|uniref:glycoside hydrolase family 6 protein n=1 Tax=Aeromicrobium stalagmiti TaxID=2738988 RepID=UPI00156A6EEF|nr:glycoside hydrolase family 6 protein [Aeromicrobium stalagmiti]